MSPRKPPQPKRTGYEIRDRVEELRKFIDAHKLPTIATRIAYEVEQHLLWALGADNGAPHAVSSVESAAELLAIEFDRGVMITGERADTGPFKGNPNRERTKP